MEVRHHPTLNCLCREDGAIYVFGRGLPHWTYGSSRGQYLRVCVDNVSRSVHRLICETFHENPDNKATVDHINRDKHDNRAENLRWATQQENCANRLVKDYTTELKLKTRPNTEFAEWYWETYHQFKRDDTAKYQRAHRFYKKYGYFPVKEQ